MKQVVIFPEKSPYNFSCLKDSCRKELLGILIGKYWSNEMSKSQIKYISRTEIEFQLSKDSSAKVICDFI